MPADQTTQTASPPFTVSEYMALHGVARATVRRWMAHGRIPYERKGGGATRAGTVLILTAERPDRLPPGSLSPDQRAGWNEGRGKPA